MNAAGFTTIYTNTDLRVLQCTMRDTIEMGTFALENGKMSSVARVCVCAHLECMYA